MLEGLVLLPEGGPLPGPESGLLSNAQKWIVWGDTHTNKAKDFIGKRGPGREHPELLCHVDHSRRVYGGGVSFPGCLWPIILLVPISGPIQGPSWWCALISVKMVSSAMVSGRLTGHIMGWRLLPPFGPSQILPGSFHQLHHVPYQDLLLWDNSCKRLLSCLAKAAVSVNCSLTVPSGGSRGESISCLFPLLEAASIPWLAAASI